MDDFWRAHFPIPNTPWTIRGYSRAAFRTGFYIPELGIMLDAGPQLHSKPDHIFITHTHGDHIASLPFTMIGDHESELHIYAPKKSEEWLRQYISALFNVNICGNMRKEVDSWYTFHPMEPFTEFQTMFRNNPYNIEVFSCIHSVPTVSYGIKTVRNKLKEEYLSLSGKEIATLKKSGVEITREVIAPTLAFVCDTTIEVFARNPSILNYPTVIVECTFLRAEDSNDSDHISWPDLKPVVLNNPKTLFILIHFSMKYKTEEISSFFEGEEKLPNIKPWIV